MKKFFDLRADFKANLNFQVILTAIYSGSQLPVRVSLAHKIEFMGFFEDVAFLVKTRQMPVEVAFYMFGGDALAAMRTPDLEIITRNPYWSLLRLFVDEIQSMESRHIANGVLAPDLLERLEK